MSTPRILIIGGGIVGSACAYELAKRGHDIVLVDRRLDEPVQSASWGNAGLLSLGHAPLTKPGLAVQAMKWMLNAGSPLYIPPRFDLGLFGWLWTFHRHCTADHLARCMHTLCRMGWLTIECIEEVIRQPSTPGAERDCDYRRGGWLEVCLTPARFDKAQRDADAIRDHGYTVEPLDGDALRQAHPIFRNEVHAALHHVDSACCSPAHLLKAYHTAARAAGADLRTGTVHSIHRTNLGKRGRITGVSLESGETIEADLTILAAGAWSSELAKHIGVACPMQAAKGYHLDLAFDDVAEFAPASGPGEGEGPGAGAVSQSSFPGEEGVPLPGVGGVLAETFVAFTPMHGRLRLAGTLELAGMNTSINRRRLGMLRVGAERYMHHLDRARIWSEWAGLRPCTPDGMPLIGRPRGVEGLYLATGHAMMGMTLGPITGRLIAMDLAGEPLPIDMTLVRADRM